MKSTLLLLMLAAMLVTACKNTTPPSNPDPEPTANTTDTPPRTKSECQAPKVGEMPESSPLMSVEAEIKNGCLVLNVSYSGGCQDHQFGLYWGEMWAESMPPQTQLYLYHNNRGDNCRAIKYEQLKFDLATIQYPGVKEAVLRLNWEGAEEQIALTYTY
ncbi:MAG: hypothetical protein AAGN35_18240 [Bacteroidota bacterium]